MGNALYRKVTSSSVGGVLLHTLNNPSVDTPAGDLFGGSVAISENYCIVGAQMDDEDGYTTGKAYIFDVLTGNLLHELHDPGAPGSAHPDYFGNSVAISGNRCIVGAYYEDDVSGNYSGKAYIFDVTTGLLLYTLDNPNPYRLSQSDYFGNSVAISGNRCIVGAYFEDEASGPNSGKAYIFDVETGNLLHTLNNPNAYGTPASDYFGNSVAISGNRCIVGAYYEDEAAGLDSGKAYIFDVETGNLLHTLNNPNAYGTPAGDYFGSSVAISGNYCVVGVYYENDVSGNYSGKAYIFDVTTGSLLHTLDDPNAYGTPAGDYFGNSVSISEDHCIVGAWYEDEAAGLDSGKAYIFSLGGTVSSWERVRNIRRKGGAKERCLRYVPSGETDFSGRINV